MLIKKSGGRIFGAQLTAAEKKAMDIEIQKGLAEYDEKHAMEIDAMILWQLHEQLGFGKKRLERFYKKWVPAYRGLIKRYEMEEEADAIWLFTHKLKDLDVDIEALSKASVKERLYD